MKGKANSAFASLSLGWVAILVALGSPLTILAQQSQGVLDPNAIMGFETLGTWRVIGNSSPPGFAAQTTTDRTQGNAAYSISNPPNLTKVISQPIASTATALAGIGNSGALLQIDVLIPLLQGNAENSGYIQPYVTSKSVGLSKVPLQQVFFNSYREGIYNTVSFTIPSSVASALNGATYNDLVFEFDISSPGKITGSYLLDNLRVYSIELPQSPTGQEPPPGYGGSVNLDVLGPAPVTQTYDLSPTQIPSEFVVTKHVDKPSVSFQLGLDGTPTTTCTYGPNPSDLSGMSWTLSSCTSGFKAGDLVNADWLSLAIVDGAATDEIRAQIALSPLGSLTGAGLLPPMPTFWGNVDTCTPAPVSGTVVTLSTSCQNQAEQADQILTNYFNQVNSSNSPSPLPIPYPNWIVTPVPDVALRHGDGAPYNFLLGPPPAAPDPIFDDGGHLNQGGTFDAYWRLNGSLLPTAVSGTDENKTHFDATFTAHAVAFGYDADVMDAKLVADTDSGQTTPKYVKPTSSGSVGFYLFGQQIYNNSINPQVAFSIDPSDSYQYTLAQAQVWIFTIQADATANADLKISAGAALQGADLSVTPTGSLGLIVKGGVGVSGVVSGTVDAQVNLVSLSTPAHAQVKWVLDTSPAICAMKLDGSLKGDLTLGSLGGKINLDATFGSCPICWTESTTLYKWPPLVSSSVNLFNDTIDTQLFGLPASLCSFPMTATIISPAQGATLFANTHTTLQGLGAPTDQTLPYKAAYTWTYTPANNADTVSVDPATATTANPIVTFSPPSSGSSSTWTIGMSAVDTINSAGGTQVMSSATASPVTIAVSNLSPGVYIDDLVGGGTSTTVNNSTVPPSMIRLQNPGPQTINGLVVGASGTLNTTFTLAACTDNTAACTLPCDGTSATNCSPTTLSTSNATTAAPSATWSQFTAGYYLLTMTTTQNGTQYGSTHVVVEVQILL